MCRKRTRIVEDANSITMTSKDYFLQLQKMTKLVASNKSPKYDHLVIMCSKIGLQFETFSAKDANSITWDDAGRLMTKIGLPTVYASYMQDTKVVSVKETTYIGHMSFNTTLDHANFAVPARYVVVGKKDDGTDITFYSDAHLIMIVNAFWNEWMIQKNANPKSPSEHDKSVMRRWFKELREQRGEGPSSMAETSSVIIYPKFFVMIGDENQTVLNVNTRTYGDAMRFETVCVGGDLFSSILKDKDRESKIQVGYVDYTLPKPANFAFLFENSGVTFDDSVKQMERDVGTKYKSEFPMPKRNLKGGGVIDLTEEDRQESMPKKNSLPFSIPCYTNISNVAITSTPVVCVKKVAVTKGGGSSLTRSALNVTRGGTNPSPAEDLPELQLYTTTAKVSDHVLGYIDTLSTKISETDKLRLRPACVMTLNMVLTANPQGHIDTITEDFAAKLLENLLKSMLVLQQDIENIPNANKFASMSNQASAQYQGGSEKEHLAKNIMVHDALPNPSSGTSMADIEALLAEGDEKKQDVIDQKVNVAPPLDEKKQDVIDQKVNVAPPLDEKMEDVNEQNINFTQPLDEKMEDVNEQNVNFTQPLADLLSVTVISRVDSDDEEGQVMELATCFEQTKYDLTYLVQEGDELLGITLTNNSTQEISIVAMYFGDDDEDDEDKPFTLEDGEVKTLDRLHAQDTGIKTGYELKDEHGKKFLKITFVK